MKRCFVREISEIEILKSKKVYNNQHMSQQAGESQKVPPLYMVESLLKVVFIVMSTINAQYTIIVGLVASILAILRVCKRPQFNKDYLAKVLLNNHGQNVLYLLIGSLGFVNYLYYAPVILFFAFNLV
jgi:preprotein translocase subunit Sss1